VYERPADQPVRFSVYNPGVQPDAFFYNVLLDYVPFTAEADLWGPDNVKTKDAFKECMRFGIITSEDDLQVVLGVVGVVWGLLVEWYVVVVFTLNPCVCVSLVGGGGQACHGQPYW
jgi:hypothetical protein